ncbi:5-oxoprolinase subunit PxpA [Treponema sp.]|uniref:LamB/YcsF family protein n=1 Tax=Treponema sp. TaxID=166 RepID=UPI00298EB492|nr:5-oxoprolinase subunit PxpA [Treponema sp.]MCR5612068.1 LamB/YcsF family protein [Treponema sp.]
MLKIDLNCDLGESFGNYKIGMDEDVIQYVSSANIACGFHAADPVVMDRTVALAKSAGVAVGAHPGFPDLVGFGRRNMNVSVGELKSMVMYQLGALDAFCRRHGQKMQHVKPHGAMYNMAGKDETMALAIAEAIAEFDSSLILLGLSGSKMLEAAAKVGLKCKKEVFADRAYEEDGSLVARTKSGAMIEDEQEAIERIITMIRYGKVRAITGREIQVEPDSVCVHGDNPKALDFVKRIAARLRDEGILMVPMGK